MGPCHPPRKGWAQELSTLHPTEFSQQPGEVRIMHIGQWQKQATENDLPKVTWQINGRVRNRTYFCPSLKPVFFPTIRDFPNGLQFTKHFYFTYISLLLENLHTKYFKHSQTDMYECSYTLIIKVAIYQASAEQQLLNISYL